MKTFLTASLSIFLVTVATADIQAPPGQMDSSDKLGRGISNVLWGWTEIFSTMVRDGDESYSKAWGSGPIRGVNRAMKRFGWGFYEISTCALPTYKGSFRAPYTYKNTIMNPTKGFLEFPPEVGYQSAANYARIQRY
jgi:putative exosortase-associated protein (TIGR04073 family)